MVTVGGILPSPHLAHQAAQIVNGAAWVCRPTKPIIAPHLTVREATVLQAQLPSAKKLTRDTVRSLGFDLEENQIEAFEKYYRQYPAFAQILT